MLKGVVIVLAIVLHADRFAHLAQLRHHLRIVIVDFNRGNVFNHSFDFILNVGNQHGVIGSQVTSGFLNDGWVRNVFVFADLFDCIDNVVGELLRTVVGGG